MAVSHAGCLFDVGDIGIRVAEGLYIHCLGVGLNGCFERLKVVVLEDSVADALISQGVGDEVVRTTIKVVGSCYVVAGLKYVL